jgi:hypothetical protein
VVHRPRAWSKQIEMRQTSRIDLLISTVLLTLCIFATDLLTLEGGVDHLHYLQIPHQLRAHGRLMGINCFAMT